jgi:hypothetical protein
MPGIVGTSETLKLFPDEAIQGADCYTTSISLQGLILSLVDNLSVFGEAGINYRQLYAPI